MPDPAQLNELRRLMSGQPLPHDQQLKIARSYAGAFSDMILAQPDLFGFPKNLVQHGTYVRVLAEEITALENLAADQHSDYEKAARIYEKAMLTEQERYQARQTELLAANTALVNDRRLLQVIMLHQIYIDSRTVKIFFDEGLHGVLKYFPDFDPTGDKYAQFERPLACFATQGFGTAQGPRS